MFVHAAWLELPSQRFEQSPGVLRPLPVIAPSRFMLHDGETGELVPDPEPEYD
ncbi:MAG: hypothetical protein WD645_03705 [Dehalococcoidia bacterium]